jgi:hypothetical protein
MWRGGGVPSVAGMDRSEGSRRTARRPLGLSAPALVGLALLAVPRVVLHDLDLITEGTFVNGLFVFVPLVVWVAVAVAARVPNPLATLTVVGAVYGVFLALVHQLLWSAAVELPATVSEPFARGSAVVASLVTGTVVGAICGAVAWALARLLAARRR